MAWEPTSYVFVGLVAASISAVLAVQSWRHRDERGARPFTLLMMMLGAWSLVYGIQLGFTTTAEQLRVQQLALAVGGTIPPIWLVFTLQYAAKEEWLTLPRQLFLAVEPAVFAGLTLTNGIHGLMWETGGVISTAAGPVASVSLGPGYYLHIVYAYLLITVGLALLVGVFVHSSLVYRRQTALLVLGTLPPFVGNIAYTLRVPWGPLPAVDPTPFAFVITGILFGLALFQFDLLERTPVARRRVLDEMGDGLIVLDTDGQVVDANAVARGALDPSPAAGQPITECCPADVDSTAAARTALDGRTITAPIDGLERAYDVDWSVLTDHRDDEIGHVVALRDVTERNTYEQRLEVAQRVLRHNLRNDMGVILSWANHLSESSTDDREKATQRIIDTASDLVDLSEKMQTLVRMEAAAKTTDTTIDVSARLEPLVERFRQEYPDATIEFDTLQEAELQLPDGAFLEVPVENLIENAIEHNDREPWVSVRVEQAAGRVTVRVEDDCPEIPAMERTVIEQGSEDPLEHGSGVGLWLAYWSVTTVGGDISFEGREPSGNVVTLEFPVVGQRAATMGVATS